jgi:hypothetical protein
MNKKDNIKDDIKNEKIKGILKKTKPKKDSSDISSYDSEEENVIHNMTDEDIKSKASQNYVETELVEKITKYFQMDELIKEKQREARDMMKELKKQKNNIETYIIGYLEEINEEYVQINGKGRLVRKISVTKGAINTDNITKSLQTGLKKTNINIDDEELNILLNNLLSSIDDNRPKKERKYIKRMKETKDKISKDTNNQINNETDDDIPKF